MEAHAHGVAGSGRLAEYRVFLVREKTPRLGAGRAGDVHALDTHDDDLIGAVEALLHGAGHAHGRRLAPDFVQHLGGLRTDALAVAGRQNDADAVNVV